MLISFLGDAITDLISVTVDMTKMVYGAMEVRKIYQKNQDLLTIEDDRLGDNDILIISCDFFCFFVFLFFFFFLFFLFALLLFYSIFCYISYFLSFLRQIL